MLKYRIVDHACVSAEGVDKLFRASAPVQEASCKLDVVSFLTREDCGLTVVIEDLGIDWEREEEDIYRSIARDLGYTYME